MRLAVACAVVLFALSGCSLRNTHKKSVELDIWSAPAGVEEQAFARLCRRFEKEHPGIVINNMGSLSADKLVRAIVAAAPPDLAYVYNIPTLGALAANDALLPLDNYFRRDGLRESDFLPGAIAQCRFRGQLFGMPTTRDSRALYRNRTRFVEAGLDPDQSPATIEELTKLAVKLTRHDASGALTQLGMYLPVDDPAILFAMFGGDLWDPQTGKISAERPENVTALRWLVELSDAEGGYRAVSAFSSGLGSDTTAQNPLATGQVAMKIDGEWEAMHLERYAPQTNYALAELPRPASRPDLSNLAWEDGDFMAIPVGSRHPDLAWEFMRWLQLPRQQAEYAGAMSNLPTIMALRDSPILSQGSRSKRALGYVLSHIASDARNARFLPSLPITQFYTDALRTAFDEALYHQKTPEQALADVQARVRREQSRYD